jgi:hypothetical protein
MPTGLLIRDFVKEYRELRFTNSGSFELSEIEHNAYLSRLTVEVDAIDAPRYGNFKTLPMNTHYGYLTTFKGTSVLENIPVKFPRQRVVEIINQGIWEYHQATESLQVLAASLQGISEASGNAILDAILGEDGARLCLLIRLLALVPGEQPSTFLLRVLGCDEPQGDAGGVVAEEYRAFPVVSPFPDIFKFKGDVPMSFRFRLESWYLVNPAVYIADNPTDTGDETEDEDEYPEPDQGDGDGDGDEFPEPDPIPSGRDPRDFPGGTGSSDWFPGARVRIRYTRNAYSAGCQPSTFPDEIELGTTQAGEYSFEYIGAVDGCGGPATPGGLRLVTPNGARVDIAVLEEQQWKLATVDSVVYFEV